MLLHQAGSEDTDNRTSFTFLKETTIKYLMKLQSSSDTVTGTIDFHQPVVNNHGEDCGCLQLNTAEYSITHFTLVLRVHSSFTAELKEKDTNKPFRFLS